MEVTDARETLALFSKLLSPLLDRRRPVIPCEEVGSRVLVAMTPEGVFLTESGARVPCTEQNLLAVWIGLGLEHPSAPRPAAHA